MPTQRTMAKFLAKKETSVISEITTKSFSKMSKSITKATAHRAVNSSSIALIKNTNLFFL